MATFCFESYSAYQRLRIRKHQSPVIGNVKYGIDDPTCPSTYSWTSGGKVGADIVVHQGHKCYITIAAASGAYDATNYIYFTSDYPTIDGWKVSGELTDLTGGSAANIRSYNFYSLFEYLPVRDVSDLIFPTLNSGTSYEYNRMFAGNEYLIHAPMVIPNCNQYSCANMFSGCTSLVDSPQLPATTLAYGCYQSMFSGCTSLKYPPQLPATTLVNYCYQRMFTGCTALINAPAITINNSSIPFECCDAMFYNCVNLKFLPNFSITSTNPTYGDYSFRQMFYYCRSLSLYTSENITSSTPRQVLSFTMKSGTRSGDPFYQMFQQVPGIRTEGMESTTGWTVYNYSEPFYIKNEDASKSVSVKLTLTGTSHGATYYGIDDESCPNMWIGGSSFTIPVGSKAYLKFNSNSDYSTSKYKTISLNSSTSYSRKISMGGNLSSLVGDHQYTEAYCFYSLFANLTSPDGIDVSKVIMDTEPIGNYAFSNMFNNSSIINSPTYAMVRQDTNTATGVFQRMFYDCILLKETFDVLPLITLRNNIYEYMYYNCSSLITAPEIRACNYNGSSFFNSMFSYCSSLLFPPISLHYNASFTGSYIGNNACYGMFRNCTSMSYPPELTFTVGGQGMFSNMFYGCSNLKLLPEIKLGINTSIPASAFNSMFRNCTSIKLSATATGQYTIPFKVVSNYSTGSGAFTSMFAGTSGTITTVTANTQYYRWLTNYTITYNGSVILSAEPIYSNGYILYNNKIISNLSSATVTLICREKKMRTKVSFDVHPYNLWGGKRMYCEEKLMHTDAVITVT